MANLANANAYINYLPDSLSLHSNGAGPGLRRGRTGVTAQPSGAAPSAPHQASPPTKAPRGFGSYSFASSAQLPRLQLAKVPDQAPGMTEACERTPLTTKLDKIQEEKEHFSQNDSAPSPTLEGRPGRDKQPKASSKPRDAGGSGSSGKHERNKIAIKPSDLVAVETEKDKVPEDNEAGLQQKAPTKLDGSSASHTMQTHPER